MTNSLMPLRVAMIGTGFIAGVHARSIAASPHLQLAGVFGRDGAKTAHFAQSHGTVAFPTLEGMLEAMHPDYVTLCTPHPTHLSLALQCLKAGVSVLIEKPLCCTAAEAEPCLALASERKLAVGVNFQMRLRPARQRMVHLVSQGCLGSLVRVSLDATDWFRSMAYYRSSPWRATWEGECGGLLMNQAPHDLDLLLSLVGMPERLIAEIANHGHEIEVEDEVMALLQWRGGAMGQLHLSTRESPGRHLVEIVGTQGSLRLEGDELTVIELGTDAGEYSQTTPETMKHPPITRREQEKHTDTEDRYRLVHENFRNHLLHGTRLICSAQEALDQVRFANALLLSAIRRKWVATPVASEEVDAVLAFLMKTRSIEAARQHFSL